MREKKFLLAEPEARALDAIAKRLPRWIKPDHLTALGVLAALGIAAAYVLSNGDELWLWAASGLLVVHWLGDSLDGTLARFRKSERPRYGYYLDHLVDAFATAAKALLGSSFRVTQHRGELLDSDLAPIVTATIHPSAILRGPDEVSREEEREAFAEDLRVVAGALAV